MFRLDINGLRFIAVISVVFFHFHIPFFDGGYAGVDIFFVISGYLMHNILSKKDINFKSIIQFYKKRFLRIYPALIVCSLVFSILYVITAPPSLIKMIVVQLISALTFTSNIYFTKELSNYFSQTSDSYIFLHTWSLGVEFQYYLLFPVFLFLIRGAKFKERYFILFGMLFSFLICMFMVHYKQKIAFFNLPFRAWELLLGAYASSLDGFFKYKKNKLIEFACIFGLILFIILSEGSADWPNLKAIIPTVLTFLILLINIDNEKVFLRNKVFQLIGLCSYSIYLYHWPIASILITHGLSNNIWIKISGLIFSIFLGLLSYLLIEKKNNFITSSPLKSITVVFFAILIPLMVIKFEVYKLWTSKENLYLDSYSQYDNSQQFNGVSSNTKKTCFLSSKKPSIEDYDYIGCTQTQAGKGTILLLGDSHIAQFSKAIREKYKNYNIIQATASGCPPIMSSKGTQYCIDLMNLVFNKMLNDKKIDIAFVGADWNNFMGNNDVISGVREINGILGKKINDVRFISQTRHYSTDLHTLLFFNKDNDTISAEDGPLNVYKRMRSEITGLKFIELYDYGCVQGKCNLVNSQGVPMFFDNNHYTYEWTQEIVRDKF